MTDAVADDAPLRLEEGERLFTIEEAAKTMGLSTKTIYRRIKDGQLAAVSAFGRPRIISSELWRHIQPIDPSKPVAS